MPLTSLFKGLSFPKRNVRYDGPRTRVAVIGTGRMGQFHLRHLAALPKAELVALVDSDPERARACAKRFHVEALSDPSHLQGRVEAVVIATPTASHYAIVRQMLEAGISCLIEKPIASTPEEASTLIQRADDGGLTLQVGHIERFNPAVIEAVRYIENPIFIEVSRLGPYDPRVAGIGVVMDLMIHDLDIVQFLVGEPVTQVEAFGARVLSQHEDIAKVRLRFANGCIADLSASRISLEKYRRIRVFQKDAYLSIDYAAPHLKIYRKKTDTVKSLSDISILKPRLEKQDPLALELDHFLTCVQEKKTPLVSGRHGQSALELARKVLGCLRVNE
jgi:predicted dehydrogenase